MHIWSLTFVLYIYLSIAVETERIQFLRPIITELIISYFFTGKRRRQEKVNITIASGLGKNITNKSVCFEAHHIYCEYFRMKNENI
jgi:hypothetical protein